MKIVYCLPQLFHPGGIERIVTIKANYLADVYGHDVTIIVTNQEGKDPYYRLLNKIKLIDLGIDYESAKHLPLLKRLVVRHRNKNEHKKKLSAILNNLKADVVVSTFTSEASILPKIKDGSKKVLETHFCRHYNTLFARNFHFPWYIRLLYKIQEIAEEKFIITKYDSFVVLTEEDKSRWEKDFNKVTNIPNALTFDDNDLPVAKLIAKKAIAVGRLDSQKSFDKLIRIWKKVLIRVPDWTLDIFGTGCDIDKLRRLIADLNVQNSITIHDPDPNIKDRYLESSLLLMTSSYEGWGLVLTEAMQLGVPVVAYACPCGPKDIIRDGIDGYLLEETDENGFIEKAARLMQNDEMRETFGNNARRDVKRYSLNRVMPLWQNLFESLFEYEKDRNTHDS